MVHLKNKTITHFSFSALAMFFMLPFLSPCFVSFWVGSHYVNLATLELSLLAKLTRTYKRSTCLSLLSAEIKGVRHRPSPQLLITSALSTSAQDQIHTQLSLESVAPSRLNPSHTFHTFFIDKLFYNLRHHRVRPRACPSHGLTERQGKR